MLDLLFVYGTLRRDEGQSSASAGRLPRGAECIGRGWTPGVLFDLGPYPGAHFDDGASHRVHGEVYRLPNAAVDLEPLDEYEGCGPDSPRPHLYARVRRPITFDDGTVVEAWAYEYRGAMSHARQIPSGQYGAGGGVS